MFALSSVTNSYWLSPWVSNWAQPGSSPQGWRAARGRGWCWSCCPAPSAGTGTPRWNDSIFRCDHSLSAAPLSRVLRHLANLNLSFVLRVSPRRVRWWAGPRTRRCWCHCPGTAASCSLSPSDSSAGGWCSKLAHSAAEIFKKLAHVFLLCNV